MSIFSFFLNNKNGGDFITFGYRYRKQIIIGIISTIIIIGIISLIVIYNIKNKDDDEEIIVEDKLDKKKKTKKENKYFKVDIKGQVNNPGIYELKSSSRVIDVIESAGGLTEDADTSVINLSKKITDEMVIIIYSREQVREFEKTKELEKHVQEKCSENEEYSLKNDACINTTSKVNGKVNINTATKEELMTLQGIGEAKANDIIKYRETNGPFQKIEDLKNVNGIGDSTLASIKENITIG